MTAQSSLNVTTILCLLLFLLSASVSTSSFIPSNEQFDPSTSHLIDPTSLPRSDVTMRAWTCHGRTQKEMVDKLASAGIIKHKPVQEAMNKVDRANYAGGRSGAYVDSPQPIGYGQTISAPHMHAHALEELIPSLLTAAHDHPDDELRILDVGCGSGYLTACFGRMVDRGPNGPIEPLVKGKVFGIDAWSELVDFSRANMSKEDSDLFDTGTVTLQAGDGWEGLPDAAPFNAIHVGAAAATFPKNLMQQLAVGGVMVIPVGPDGGYQNLYKVEKLKHSPTFDKGNFAIKNLLGVRYVPLFHP